MVETLNISLLFLSRDPSVFHVAVVQGMRIDLGSHLTRKLDLHVNSFKSGAHGEDARWSIQPVLIIVGPLFNGWSFVSSIWSERKSDRQQARLTGFGSTLGRISLQIRRTNTGYSRHMVWYLNGRFAIRIKERWQIDELLLRMLIANRVSVNHKDILM